MVKKIILMYDFLSELGGVERIMLFQANTLKKAGYKVSFAFAYINPNLKERYSNFDLIEYSKFPIKNETLQILSSITKDSICKKFKDADLIICHSFPASYLAYRIKKMYKIPYILHLHHPPQFLYNVETDWAKSSFKRKFSFLAGKIFGNSLRRFDRFCVKNADGYILECQTVRRIIKETYNVEGEVIYPTIDKNFKLLKKSMKGIEKLGIKNDYILGSGRIIKQKRFDYFIKAVSKIKNKNILIVLAGKYDLKEKDELENLIRKYKINALILGPVPIKELVQLYNNAELCVLTCPKEWFGLVPIESMACGCPVISWKDNFGPQESIIEGKNGLLAKPYSIDDLARNIDKAINMDWKRENIVKSIDKFKEEKQSKKLIKVVKRFI